VAFFQNDTGSAFSQLSCTLKESIPSSASPQRNPVGHVFLKLLERMGNVTANPSKFDLLYEDPSCLTYIHKNDPNVFLQTNDDHRAFLDIAVRTIEDKEAFWFLLKFVLKKSPEACLIRNKSGQLPIHTALNEVKPSLIINLFQKASPLSVEERCPLSGLYPFQLAAMSR